MSRVAGTQAEDLGRTTAWVGIPAEVLDKAAAPERAVGIDGKTKKPGPKDPAFQNETTEPVSKRPLLPNLCVPAERDLSTGSNFNPQNTPGIPVVKIFAFLDLGQN
jgi:hypothetical protein